MRGRLGHVAAVAGRADAAAWSRHSSQFSIKSGRWSTAIRGDHYRSAKTSSSFDSTPSGPAQRPRGSLFEDQQPGADIRISADPSSARMPTSIDTNAEPLLSPLYLLILFSSLLSIYVWGTPLGIPLSPIEDHTSLSM